MIFTLAEAAPGAEAAAPLVTDPGAVLAILTLSLAAIFAAARTRAGTSLFRIIPALVFCYFVPTALATFGVIPHDSPLYDWIKTFLLPCSLTLLILSLDVPAILRLGPKAVIMMLAGTVGVVIGGPLALAVCGPLLSDTAIALPPESWKGFAALSGSWIGGGANFVAIGNAVGASSDMIALMVIPDVFVANIWMAVLLSASVHQKRIDRRTGADTTAIQDLQVRIEAFQASVNRIPQLPDLLTILAVGFAATALCGGLGASLAPLVTLRGEPLMTATVWTYVLVTTLALLMSFTPARKLEGVGASKVGSVMLYLLVASIGAHADFGGVVRAPGLIIVAGVWMLVHITVLLTVAWLIRAPLFFVAVGSQANIGGAASAPIVAAAFHPSLASVGVLLAVAGYVLGTYAGLLCAKLLALVAGAEF